MKTLRKKVENRLEELSENTVVIGESDFEGAAVILDKIGFRIVDIMTGAIKNTAEEFMILKDKITSVALGNNRIFWDTEEVTEKHTTWKDTLQVIHEILHELMDIDKDDTEFYSAVVRNDEVPDISFVSEFGIYLEPKLVNSILGVRDHEVIIGRLLDTYILEHPEPTENTKIEGKTEN